jgi:uncharacterized protein involved in propanediol utilization
MQNSSPTPGAAPIDTDLALSTGCGTSIGQHGELLQGQIEDDQHRSRRFLISLPCPSLLSRVTVTATTSARCLTVEPSHKKKLREVVQLTLAHFGLPDVGGSIVVESNIEEGKGYGSSTADCTAGVRAAANAVGQVLNEAEVAKLVVTAEIASDNFMFSRAVLFAHREGVALEDLGPQLPKLDVLGIDTDVNGAVYTLDYPPATYDWYQIQSFQTLIAGARRAIRDGDVALLGRVATASAVLNQRFLPKPLFAELRRLAECVHAAGIAVAHSGTVLSLLFDASDPRREARIEQSRKELESLRITAVRRFQT